MIHRICRIYGIWGIFPTSKASPDPFSPPISKPGATNPRWHLLSHELRGDILGTALWDRGRFCGRTKPFSRPFGTFPCLPSAPPLSGGMKAPPRPGGGDSDSDSEATTNGDINELCVPTPKRVLTLPKLCEHPEGKSGAVFIPKKTLQAARWLLSPKVLGFCRQSRAGGGWDVLEEMSGVG